MTQLLLLLLSDTLVLSLCQVLYSIAPPTSISEHPYSISFEVLSRLGCVYDINAGTVSKITSEYSILVISENRSLYSIFEGRLMATSEHPYSISFEVLSRLECVYDINNSISSFGLVIYNLNNFNTAISYLAGYYVLLSQVQVFDEEVLIYSQSNKLTGVEAFQLKCDEDSFVIQVSITTSSITDFLNCEPGTPITIRIGSQDYNFVVVERERTKYVSSDGSILDNYKIIGLSPAYKLKFPHARPVSKDWVNTTTAKDIVKDLLRDEDIELDWQIIDWTIPSGLVKGNNRQPIDIIQEIVNAAGGLVVSSPEGKLVCRYKYPTSPKYYQDTGVARMITMQDVFSLHERLEQKPGYNAVLISNHEFGMGTQIYSEIEEEKDGFVLLRVFLHPWDDVRVWHSSKGVYIEYLGVDEETLDETIEIVAGEGQTRRFVSKLISYSYHYTDLGQIESDGNHISTEEKGYSLLNVQYVSKYHRFRISTDIREKVQLIISSGS